MPTIAIYVSEEQYVALVAQAKVQNQKVSEFVKSLAIQKVSNLVFRK